MSEATVTDNAAQKRYELREGGAIGGWLEYEDRGPVRVFTHTRVPAEHEGKGYGSRLVKAALDDMRRRKRHIVAQCEFVDAYMRRHPEYEYLRADAGAAGGGG
jgi:predicted GNAT family acetyltransferase